MLNKAESRIQDLESALDDLKDKLDETLRQLNLAEIKLGDLVREKELVVELKSSVGDKDRDIDSKRDYIIVPSFDLETRERDSPSPISAGSETGRS